MAYTGDRLVLWLAQVANGQFSPAELARLLDLIEQRLYFRLRELRLY
ncbi:hypothetical protein [Hymenobacter guriensis]|uniref:Uncharacterized protein n=1 Tax=Hymenobacter guriensis TaxID=2793065 RepID=A0ABS0L4H9_9BACT|nr:hypothetical protein [Hymenobacter guriensis]MBG8554976.1 hypothetical protein [Hymenobacter guriensis]